MPRNGSNKNSSSFQSDLLKSKIKFCLTSCNIQTIEKFLKSTKPVSVQIQQNKHRQHWNKSGNSSKLTRKTEKPPKSIVFTVNFICLLGTIFALILVYVLSLQTMFFQQMFENTYVWFLTARLIIKIQSKET